MLAQLALIALMQSQAGYRWPIQSQRGPSLEQSGELDVLALVKPTGNVFPSGKGLSLLQLEVVESINPADSGALLGLATASQYVRDLPRGETYLLIGRRARDGKVYAPQFTASEVILKGLESSAVDAVFIYGLLPTKAKSLIRRETAGRQLQLNIVEAFRGADESQTLDIWWSLRAIRDPELKPESAYKAITGNEVTRAIEEIAAEAEPTHRSRLLGILVQMHLMGSTTPYLESLIASPDSYSDKRMSELLVPADWTFDSNPELLSLAEQAVVKTNDMYVAASLAGILPKLDEESTAKVARWLSKEDRIVRSSILMWLAQTQEDPNAPPITHDGKALAYWKARFGIK